MGVFPSRQRRRPPKWPAKALFRFAVGNLLLANLYLSSRRRRPRSTSAPVAWQVLRLGQPRELRRPFGGESEFELDQTPAHEGAEVIAPHEFLIWRIEVFERLTAQAPPQRPPDIVGEVRDRGGNSSIGSAIAFGVDGPAIVMRRQNSLVSLSDQSAS